MNKSKKKIVRSRYFHEDFEVYGKLGRQTVSSVMFLGYKTDRKRNITFVFSLRPTASYFMEVWPKGDTYLLSVSAFSLKSRVKKLGAFGFT